MTVLRRPEHLYTAKMSRILAALLLLSGLAAPVQAQGPMLVELFASKNCRACPAAYRTLKQVEAERGDQVIVLTWAVDYWDYLGGKEQMALPESNESASPGGTAITIGPIRWASSQATSDHS